MQRLTFTSLSTSLLVSHGSRDYRPQITLERLGYLVQQQLNKLEQSKIQHINAKTATLKQKASSFRVETATLEFAPYSLHERIEKIAQQIQQAGGNHLKIIPLFLLPGIHVTEDIPAQIAIAKQSLDNSFALELCPYLGSYPKMRQLLAHQFSLLSAQKRILLSHGSRRPQANQLIEEVASELGAKPAYWTVTPSLAEQVEALANSNSKSIAILPYFLFKGGLTDAIVSSVQKLQQTYPLLKLELGEPLEATPELANLIAEFNF